MISIEVYASTFERSSFITTRQGILNRGSMPEGGKQTCFVLGKCKDTCRDNNCTILYQRQKLLIDLQSHFQGKPSVKR